MESPLSSIRTLPPEPAGLKAVTLLAPAMSEVDDEAWAERLRANRREKDEFFDEHQQSPIPPGERDEFDGLAYFDPDPDYRVEATVEIHEDPGTVELDTTGGRPMSYLRIATFHFELNGDERSLHAYRRSEDDSRTLFVPFSDETSGRETYEEGRYMELESERELEDGQAVVADFNLAYSPFCAFNESFSCPIPPAENHLVTPVEAGERLRD